MMLFWRLFFVFVLVFFHSLGLRFEILIAAAAFLAMFFPQYWELAIFAVFTDALLAPPFGVITIIFLFMIFFEEFLKKIIEPVALLSRFILASSGALFFTLLFFGWRFYSGASFDIIKFLYSLLIEFLSIGVFMLIFTIVNFFFNVSPSEKN